MSLSRALALLLLIVPARAKALTPGDSPHFPVALASEVFTEALSFIQPRTLEAYSLATLALWGLRGLSALDPSLSTNISGATLRLAAPDRILAVEPEPGPADAAGWGQAIASLAAVAWRHSPSVRALGPSGVTEAFFDELFNHFDPYSRYVPPGQAAVERAQRSGRAGAGLVLAAENRTIVIEAVIAGGPAAIAGVRPGERLVFVNGIPVAGKGIPAVQHEIGGPVGSSVVLTLAAPRRGFHSVTLVRRRVPPETVFASRSGSILVLRISGFDATTGIHLADEVAAGLSTAHQPKGLVLDLRGNRGGLLDQAVYAADALLRRGLIAYTVGRDPAALHVWEAGGADMASGLPIVVIVDGRTASAAEVLTAALEDNGRAVVVGSATLGKGLVQTIEPLPDGGELFVTWSQVLAPRGWPIEGLGVLPEVCTSVGQLELGRQLASLAQGVQPMARDIYQHETARAPLPLAQILAIRGTCPAAVGTGLDMAAARALIQNPAAYAAALLPPAGRPLPPPLR